jgi:NAD(P)-dependent dehydrogenase (short-subunit alcohol dehydrogenase family)
VKRPGRSYCAKPRGHRPASSSALIGLVRAYTKRSLAWYDHLVTLENFDFTGRCVLVTGGVRGIGLGVTRRFLEYGADVVVCARTKPEFLPAAAGRTALYIQADVRDPGQVDRLVQDATDRFGRLDVVVNNAGGTPQLDAADAAPKVHSKIVELNLLAPLHVAQRAYQVMQHQPDGGSVIMIGSVSGVRPSPGSAAYGAAKAGLHHLATSLAVEWAPKVRVNSVVVGMVATEHAAAHYGDASSLAAVAATVPLGRMGRPEDVADACLFLASPLASYVTGSALLVHGGGERPAFLNAVESA